MATQQPNQLNKIKVDPRPTTRDVCLVPPKIDKQYKLAQEEKAAREAKEAKEAANATADATSRPGYKYFTYTSEDELKYQIFLLDSEINDYEAKIKTAQDEKAIFDASYNSASTQKQQKEKDEDVLLQSINDKEKEYNRNVDNYNVLIDQLAELKTDAKIATDVSDEMGNELANILDVTSYTSNVAQKLKYMNIGANIDLYNAIQKENIILQQYSKDLQDKLYIYDYRVENKWENIAFYKTFNKNLFYVYYGLLLYIAATLFAGYGDIGSLYKIAILFVLVMFPLYITQIEFYIKDQIYYVYCLVLSKPYKKRTIKDVPYDYYFY